MRVMPGRANGRLPESRLISMRRPSALPRVSRAPLCAALNLFNIAAIGFGPRSPLLFGGKCIHDKGNAWGRVLCGRNRLKACRGRA
jgi:hypothetical protein